MKPTTTVVVTCTSPERLGPCLSRLRELDPAPHEVVVLDASGDDNTARLVAAEFPHATLVRDGSRSHAATGDVVAFVDDAGIVERGWLGELLAPYADPEVIGVGGRVVTGAEAEGADNAGDIGRLLPNGRLTQNFDADPGRVIQVDHLPGVNMSFRRSALEGIRAWDGDLTDPGADAAGVALRLRHVPGKLVFQPRAVIRHAAGQVGDTWPPADRRLLFSQRKEHIARLVGAFGWRDPVVRNYARTTVQEQEGHVRLMLGRMGPHKADGTRRPLRARVGSLAALGGPFIELAGLAAGVSAGVGARRREPRGAPRAAGRTGAAAIRTRTLRLSELEAHDEERWAALSATALEPNPFLDPRFVMSAHRTLDTTADLRLVVAEDADRWLAVVPLSVVGRFPATPVRHASTAGPFLGKWASLCVPLVDRDDPAAALTAVLRHLSSSRSGLPGLVELTLVPDAGPVATVLRECCRTLRVPVQERSRFSRAYAEAGADVVAPDHLSSNRRKQFRRKRNALERLIGAPVEYLDHGSDPAALDALLTMEAAGWKGKRGSAIRMKGMEQEWFNRYMEQFLAAGDCRVFEVRAGDVTLHMSLVLVLGRTAFGTIDAYDEEYQDQSPGVLGRVLEQEALLAREDIDAFDPCVHPKYTESTALYPGSRDMVSLLVGTRGAAKALLALRPLALRLRRGASATVDPGAGADDSAAGPRP